MACRAFKPRHPYYWADPVGTVTSSGHRSMNTAACYFSTAGWKGTWFKLNPFVMLK